MENDPEGQGRQEDGDDAPVVVEYVPAGHNTHDVEAA
jgi:hypothetical protein